MNDLFGLVYGSVNEGVSWLLDTVPSTVRYWAAVHGYILVIGCIFIADKWMVIVMRGSAALSRCAAILLRYDAESLSPSMTHMPVQFIAAPALLCCGIICKPHEIVLSSYNEVLGVSYHSSSRVNAGFLFRVIYGLLGGTSKNFSML